HIAQLRQCVREPNRLRRKRRGRGFGIKTVQKISDAKVEGLTLRGEFRDFRQGFRNHTLPSSNKPSTRYWAFTNLVLGDDTPQRCPLQPPRFSVQMPD